MGIEVMLFQTSPCGWVAEAETQKRLAPPSAVFATQVQSSLQPNLVG